MTASERRCASRWPTASPTVTLDRPDKRNALDGDLLRAIPEALKALDADDDVAVVILTGSDPAFCAGLDLGALAAGGLGFRPELGQRGPFPIMSTPIIGAINGPAVTGGFELALDCDLLIASERARFADTHARVGVMPDWGLSVLLPQAIGVRRARLHELHRQLRRRPPPRSSGAWSPRWCPTTSCSPAAGPSPPTSPATTTRPCSTCKPDLRRGDRRRRHRGLGDRAPPRRRVDAGLRRPPRLPRPTARPQIIDRGSSQVSDGATRDRAASDGLLDGEQVVVGGVALLGAGDRSASIMSAAWNMPVCHRAMNSRLSAVEWSRV